MPFGWAAAAGAVATLASGALQSDASKGASQTQAKAGQEAIAEQRREFNVSQTNLAPYQKTGVESLYLLKDALGLPGAGLDMQREQSRDQVTQMIRDHMQEIGQPLDPAWKPDDATVDQWGKLYVPGYGQTQAGPNTGALTKPFNFDISQDPGYQFRLDEGNKNLENSAAARGSQLSGATLKELLKYGSDYASGEFNAAFSRDQATKAQLLSTLTAGAGIGIGATNTGVQAGQASATGIGNTMTGIGNAQAAGQIGQANAFSGAAGSLNQSLLLRSAFANQNPGVSNVNSGVNLPSAGSGDVSPIPVA